MAHEKIDNIVTEPVVVVHDPKMQELHQKLDGKPAMPGSPAGREAKPVMKQKAWAGTLKGVYD